MGANDVQKVYAVQGLAQVAQAQHTKSANPFNLNQLRERLSALDNDVYEIGLMLEKQADSFLGRSPESTLAGLSKGSTEIPPNDLNSLLISLESRVSFLRRHANRF